MGISMSKSEVTADLILLHAPALFDFRERDDILLGSLADSVSVNVTPVFEIYPLGFLALKSHLTAAGLRVEIINIASLMLQYPDLDLRRLLGRLKAPIFGIDLHWMVHCQGALALAELIKEVHPEALTMMGGISSTYFADELATYPQVDFVVRGYDTLDPARDLVQAAASGKAHEAAPSIPNLVYRESSGDLRDTGFSYRPAILNNVHMDWSYFFPEKINLLNIPTLMVLPNTGCAHDCGWCGGSRFAYKNIMGMDKKTVVYRDTAQLEKEVATINRMRMPINIYSLQAYSEPAGRLVDYLDAVEKSGCIRSVALEMFRLPDRRLMDRMASTARNTDIFINLSPESHDDRISRLSGRGTYSMEQMEAWIRQALDAGIKGVYIWFFIGMPEQTPASVLETADYCARLMSKFRHEHVVPTITPMAPFLDPGSRFFEEPDKHGYRVHHRTLAEHVAAVQDPRWQKRLNYDTKWLPREEFLPVIHESLKRMVQYKQDFGRLNRRDAASVLDRMERNLEMTRRIDAAYGDSSGGRLPADLRADIAEFNRKTLSYSSDAIVQIERPLGGRWFDDYCVPADIIEACLRGGNTVSGRRSSQV